MTVNNDEFQASTTQGNASIEQLGWNEFHERHFAPFRAQGSAPGRIALEHKHIYRVLTEHGELMAEVTGKLRHAATGRADFPAVGDWVVLSVRPEERKATIHAVLPRKSKFSRKVAGGETEEQIVATNVDTLFLVNSLNHDLNLRRMERYLLMAWDSGASPVIVLSKADLCDNLPAKLAEVQSIAFGVPIHVISALADGGLDELAPYIRSGQTVALLGSSGVGKSTIVNRLLGHDVQRVQEIREDDSRGRHTTTHREMICLPTGGLLIDTPGMRELQLWAADEGTGHSAIAMGTGDTADGDGASVGGNIGRNSIGGAFEDIAQLTEQCRFGDCGHQSEPGCAVQQALADGTLSQDRYTSYVKLQRELAFIARKTDKRAQSQEKNRYKQLTMQANPARRR